MFKKFVPLLAVLFVLAACTNTEEAVENKEISDSKKEPLQSDNFQNQASEDLVLEEENSLPELPIITQQIDTEDYNLQTVTDNEGKRILLILDDEGTEQYKSIFIKKTKRLKIIDLANDREIFNDLI